MKKLKVKKEGLKLWKRIEREIGSPNKSGLTMMEWLQLRKQILMGR